MRKTKWTDAQIRKLAALPFKAGRIKLANIQTNEEFAADVLPSLRLAAVLVNKSKPELITVARNLPAQANGTTLTGEFSELAKRLKGLADLCDTAEARLWSALAAIAAEDGAKTPRSRKRKAMLRKAA